MTIDATTRFLDAVAWRLGALIVLWHVCGLIS